MNEIDLYKSGLSLNQVSKKTSIPVSTLRFRFKKIGILRSRTESIKLAGKQGRLGSGMRGKKRQFTEQHKNRISKSKTGVGKGVSIKPNGYIEITMGENKGRLQHVVVMENIIGRRLHSNECVHHRNHIKTDNRPENLELMTRAEHSRLHALENKNLARDSLGRFKK